jgi:hypothetical protein
MDIIGVVSELCGNDPETIVRNTANDNHTVTVYPMRSPMSAGILNYSTYFPFDRQECDLEFVAWSLSREDVYLAQDSDGIELSLELKRHGEWDIVSSRATDELETHETKVKFTIVIDRKPLFVIINMITPIILLFVLSIFTFKIPADIGERMGYTVTVWLSFAVFLTIVSGSLPQSSETTPVISTFVSCVSNSSVALEDTISHSP